MEVYTSVVLTLLTITTGILTVVNFAIARGKNSNDSGRRSGKIEQKLDDIDKRTELIQNDVKELREKDNATAQLIVATHESVKSAHKRIDDLERRI